ncbi:MAG TPA: addiction module protein [Thermoanaerobaculia bacterium]|nr:addiction module protein [Thermoanaerobaculia bacterium]
MRRKESREVRPSVAHEHEKEWAREIERRMADYRAGRIKTLSWDEVRAYLHRSDR